MLINTSTRNHNIYLHQFSKILIAALCILIVWWPYIPAMMLSSNPNWNRDEMAKRLFNNFNDFYMQPFGDFAELNMNVFRIWEKETTTKIASFSILCWFISREKNTNNIDEATLLFSNSG